MQKGIKNALMANGNSAIGYTTNNPYNGDTLHQYYADETKTFFHENLKWSSNFVRAQVQGVNYSDFFAYTYLNVRTSNVIDPTTGKNLGSDWQRIIIENPSIDFLPRGAKVVYNGNVWLVTNPMNIQSVTGTSVVRRCNATWHYLDYYGNVKAEPFCYGQGDINLATGNSVKENMILMDSYQHCVMQYNPDTAVIAHNMRMILGNQAYSVRGVQNFVQEFSLDENSTHIQFFDLEAAEPLEIDDMEAKVAGGKTFHWEISVSGSNSMNTGTEQTLTANSLRNREPPSEETSYLWESSDETVATVDESGKVQAKSEGNAVIVCQLEQNPKYATVFPIFVKNSVLGIGVEWKGTVPQSIVQYQTITLEAAIYENGVETENTATFAFEGPENGQYYSAEIDGNKATITCWLPSEIPLTVIATYAGHKVEADVLLKGW